MTIVLRISRHLPLLALSTVAGPLHAPPVAETAPAPPVGTAEAATVGRGPLPAAEGDAVPLTLTTWLGESVLEQRPSRIATVGFSVNTDMLQALGATPVYTITEDVDYAWRDQEWFRSIEVIDTATRKDPINVEGIAAAVPDLIIAMNSLTDEGEYERLRDIAPVLDVATAEARRPVRLACGPAAGRHGSGSVRRTGRHRGGRGAISGRAASSSGPHDHHRHGLRYELRVLHHHRRHCGVIMSELGFAPGGGRGVSAENTSLLDADALVVIYADEETREAREGLALFQDLPPVSEGRYVSLTNSAEDPTALVTPDGRETANPTWVLRRGASAVSLPWAVDVVANQWLADLDLR